jgi:outer membrane lipoprotein-sorting protein
MTNTLKAIQRFARFFSLALLCLLPFAALAPKAAAQTADELVAKVLAARGGVDKMRAIHAQRVTGKISFGPGAEGPFNVEFERPLKMHMEITVGGQTIVRVYDGKSAGWVINPFAPDKDVHPMEADELHNISDEADFDGPLLDYQSKGNHIELAGKDEVGGKAVTKLKLTNKNGNVRTYFFDSSTYLLTKWEGTRKAENQEIPVVTLFGDYREVQGMKFAFQIDSGSPGTEQTQQITIEKIEINPQIDESHFAKPVAASAAPSASEPPAPSHYAAAQPASPRTARQE